MCRLLVTDRHHGGYRYDRQTGRIGPVTVYEQVTLDTLARHFSGGPIIGLHTSKLCRDGVTRSRSGCTDIDRHSSDDDPRVNWRAALH
jgi:hypothetical protein